ncbi:hypothetical protein [Empedobacter brevis]|uniref:hypothetical protein n=1 Tax=Empedobacter brevis TaxID=247 RepID=UPI0028964B63|nr:hypothetical protein [Empedobacter brevis]
MDVYLVDENGKYILAKRENKTDVLYGYDSKNQTIKDYNEDGKVNSKDGLIIQTKGLLSQMLYQKDL